MLTKSEIAWLLLELLGETRHYCGVQFRRTFASDLERLNYARGLLIELPLSEKTVVAASFARVYAAVANHRVVESSATHAAPGAIQ